MKSLPEVLDSKDKYYELVRQGCVGNQLRVWSSIAEFQDSGYEGAVSLRYTGKTGKGPWPGNKIPAECAVATLEIMCEQEGYSVNDFCFSESAPDHMLTIQGEVQQCVWGLHLRYSHVRKSMREALSLEQAHSRGVYAALLLQRFLYPASYDEINNLLDWFPEHVIEFSAYSSCVGALKGRNALIWEVRKDGEPPGWHVLERKLKKQRGL